MTDYHGIVWAIAGSAVFTYGYLERKKGMSIDTSKQGFEAKMEDAGAANRRTEGVFSMVVGALFILVAIVG